MDVEQCIRENVPWTRLPDDVKQLLGNSAKEYDKLVLEYSIRNQLRHKTNLVRNVKAKANDYYDILMRYSASHLMLYPYHLSDVVNKEMRITPFSYYTNIILDMLNAEKSYDSLPNFTAADACRLLGIGRNRYIDLMNQNRSYRKIFNLGRSITQVMPKTPQNVKLDPWWRVRTGNICEADVKVLSPEEKRMVDTILDHENDIRENLVAGQLERNVLQMLFERGLVYCDVPVEDTDHIYLAPLDGFVMNRVLGDYFENLLYKVFVAIDEQTTVREMADMLHIDLQLVQNAVSLFCRLGFARKRVTGIESVQLHPSWRGLSVSVPAGRSPSSSSPSLASPGSAPMSPSQDEASIPLVADFASLELDEDDSEELVNQSPSAKEMTESVSSVGGASTSEAVSSNRAAFVFDSTLAAFLMMGNLSQSLKSHAVTLFEVGKLPDEQMTDFLEQLESVNQFGEGEAQRYSEHAMALLDSLRSLKKDCETDMLRGESLLSLDSNIRARVLAKSYGILVAMAPLSIDACTLPVSSIPFIGPSNPESCSPWLRLALYGHTGSGPCSLFYPRGSCLTRLPALVCRSARLLLSSPNHEPQIVSTHHVLPTLNDLLMTNAYFVQEYPAAAETPELVYVPFPYLDDDKSDKDAFANHPAILKLNDRIGLPNMCGYVTLLKMKAEQEQRSEEDEKENRKEKEGREEKRRDTLGMAMADPVEQRVGGKLNSGESFSDFVLLDCVFGIPLFNRQLNKTICERVRTSKTLHLDNRVNIQFANKQVIELVYDIIKKHNGGITNIREIFGEAEPKKAEMLPPTQLVIFDAATGRIETRRTLI